MDHSDPLPKIREKMAGCVLHLLIFIKIKKVQKTSNTFSYQKGSLTWTCKECGSVNVVLMCSVSDITSKGKSRVNAWHLGSCQVRITFVCGEETAVSITYIKTFSVCVQIHSKQNGRTGRTGGALAYLVWGPRGRLVLVVGEDEEGECAELGVLQGRVELVAGGLQVFVRRGAVQDEHHALRALVVPAPILLDVVGTCSPGDSGQVGLCN